jgi:hypothetical protein
MRNRSGLGFSLPADSPSQSPRDTAPGFRPGGPAFRGPEPAQACADREQRVVEPRVRRLPAIVGGSGAVLARARRLVLLLTAASAVLLAGSRDAGAQSEIIGFGSQVFNSAWNHEAFVEVAAGGAHTVARRSDGSVVAWGSNDYGQCNVPALPSGLTYAEVGAGGVRTVARLAPAPPCGSTSSYCGPAAANSASASGASLSVDGCPGLTANDLVFSVSGLPPGGRGILYYGAQQQHLPFGSGWACVGGGVQRVMPALVADPSGVVSYALDLTQFPFSGSARSIAAGSAWNFQYCYRDPGSAAGFNFSNAQHIVFGP